MLGNRLSREQKRALLPALVRAVKDGDSGAHNAVVLLRYYGEYAEVVVPVLLKALKDGKPSVRGYAAEALNRIAPKVANEAGATEVLIEVANDPDDQVGFRAVEGLGRATNRVEVAVPAKRRALVRSSSGYAAWVRSGLRWSDRIDSASSVRPQASPPIAHAPKPMEEMFQPVRPRGR